MFFMILIAVVIISVIGGVVLNGFRKKTQLEEEKKEKERLEQEMVTKAEQGDIQAQVELSKKFLYGGDSIEKNTSVAIDWLNKAIKQGSADAHFMLANCYKSGEGVQKDLAQAKCHFQQAANKGHMGAKEQLMDAVDYYNRGIRNLNNNNYSDAESDFSAVIYRDLEGKTHDIKMMAYLNYGIAIYNQAMKMNIYSDASMNKKSDAISIWDCLVREDFNAERISQAKALADKALRFN